MARSKNNSKRRISNDDNKVQSKRPLQNFRPDSSSSFDPSKSRIKALKDWDENDMRDDEDQFFDGADKILFENGANQDSDDYEAPEQLLKLDSEEEESSEEEDEDEDEDEIEEAVNKKKSRKPKKKIDNSQKGRFGKKPSTDSDSGSGSDSDVESEDGEQPLISGIEELAGDQSSSQADEDEDEETWKSYHVLKSKKKKKKGVKDDAEEAERRALELAEVRRLQAKARAKLTISDFKSYLDYASEDELVQDDSIKSREVAKADSKLGFVKEFDSEPEAVAFLLRTKPEALALVNDFGRSVVTFAEIQDEILGGVKPEGKPESNEFQQAISWLHYHIMATYLSTTAFYIYLSLKIPSSSPSLLSEVTRSLVELRTTIDLMEQVGLIGDSPLDGLDSDLGEFDAYPRIKFSSMEADQELRDLLYDQSVSDDTDQELTKDKKSKSKKRKTPESEIEPQKGSEPLKIRVKSNKKQKKAENKEEKSKNRVEDPNIHLKNLPPRVSGSGKSKDILRLAEDLEKDFVENDDSSVKSKKKDLRFYTSKIDAKGKRREKAIRGGSSGYSGGDSDLPYITKEARRREFLKNQNHSQGAEDGDDGMDFEMDGFENVGGGEDGDYYNTIKELKKSSKLAKKQKHDEQKMAERDALTEEVESGSGPREITRQILKNKGLTPKRAKENRNPRVKKRLRFEKANKKIASQRPIYKADQASKSRELNGYSGEKTGVKANVVKSRKL